MKKVLILSIVALSIMMSAPARSELIDYGLDREMFYDTATGLYWYDPVVFLGQSREQIDLFLADNPEWKLANIDELIALFFNCQYVSGSVPGISMAEYLGDPTFIANSRNYWRGYYTSATNPLSNVFLSESIGREGGFSGMGTGTSLPTDGQLTGAWVNTDFDPLAIDVEPDPIALLLDTIDIIDSFAGTEALKNENMTKAFTNKINAVLYMIEQGLYEDALDKLEQDILQKTDGCVGKGKPDKNDWIKDCDAQEEIYDNIMDAIGILSTLT